MNSRNGEWDWFNEIFNRIFGNGIFDDSFDDRYFGRNLITKSEESNLQIEDKEKEMVVKVRMPNIVKENVVYNKAKNLFHVQVVKDNETILSKDIRVIFDLDKIKTIKMKNVYNGVDLVLKKPKSARDIEVVIE